ncbi:unnamed protein product [Caenorhabditis sp. 36 PRJEB53466]|nr:unnamed protein product [Caenorhabditis sp. 36 PRJEB53466]
MALSYNLLFTALAFSAVVLAHPGGRHGGGRGGPGGHGGPPPPPFLQNVTDEGRQAFFAIVSNSSLTIAETETEIDSWASTYGVSEEVSEFKANLTAKLDEIKQNVTAVISNLPSVQSQLEAIFANKDQTRQQQKEAIEQLKQQYPQEVGVLFFLAAPKGPKGGPGGQGPFGGFPGNQGGSQGGFGGNQGGFGGQQQGGNQGGRGNFGRF